MKNFESILLSAIDVGKEQYGNASALSRASGVSAANLSRWAAKKQSPKISEYSAVLEAVHAQLVFPGEAVRDFARLLPVEDLDAFRYRNAIKRGEDVPVSVLEYVAKAQHRQPDILFSLDQLKNLGVEAADGLLFSCDNDAMDPIISRGDHVLIDRKKTLIEDGKIYLIHSADSFFLRYVSRDLSGELILHTPGHVPTTRVTPESLPVFEIIGKVVWIGHFCD